jgi:hypothetical protein
MRRAIVVVGVFALAVPASAGAFEGRSSYPAWLSVCLILAMVVIPTTLEALIYRALLRVSAGRALATVLVSYLAALAVMAALHWGELTSVFEDLLVVVLPVAKTVAAAAMNLRSPNKLRLVGTAVLATVVAVLCLRLIWTVAAWTASIA